jgi:hypothetical protein
MRVTYLYLSPGKLQKSIDADAPYAPRLFFEDGIHWATATKLKSVIESTQSGCISHLEALVGLRTTGRIAQSPNRNLCHETQPLWLPARTLVSYRINRQLSGWNLPPLVIRAFGAHCQNRTFDASQLSRHKPASKVTTPNLRLQHRALSHSRLPKHPWRRAGKI